MRRTKRLHYRITHGRFTPSVALFIALLCWAVMGLLQSDGGAESVAMWLNRGAGFLLCALTGWLLIPQNNAFSIVRTRTPIQLVFYVLLVAATPMLHTVTIGNLVVFCLLAMSSFLFAAYQHPFPVMKLFYAYLFIGMGSILLPQVMFLLPIYWLTTIQFQALSLRSFCASLVGFALPYWFLWGHAYFHQELPLFYRPFAELMRFDPLFAAYEPWLLATLGYTALLWLICGIHFLSTSHEDKLRTRSYLQFLLWHTLLLWAYILLQPVHGEAFLPTLYVGISILCTHYFVLANNRSANLLFIITMVGWLLLWGFNLWNTL